MKIRHNNFTWYRFNFIVVAILFINVHSEGCYWKVKSLIEEKKANKKYWLQAVLIFFLISSFIPIYYLEYPIEKKNYLQIKCGKKGSRIINFFTEYNSRSAKYLYELEVNET